MVNNINSYKSGPDQDGRFGIFGGRFVAETLMPLILDLEKAYDTVSYTHLTLPTKRIV